VLTNALRDVVSGGIISSAYRTDMCARVCAWTHRVWRRRPSRCRSV